MVQMFIAMLIPALLGIPCFWLLWKDAHLAARLGYGYLAGMYLTTLALWVWGQWGLPYHFYRLAMALLLAALFLLLITIRLGRKTEAKVFTIEVSWARWIWWIFFILLAMRFFSVLQEVILRPLYPWDAWMNWAPKAKTWFGLREWVPFVHLTQWPTESLSQNAYTLGNPLATEYPPFVPLVQLWAALGLGEWRDNLINLPWVIGVVSLGLAFYGQLRTLGIKPVTTIVITYLLFSMPYLNTHVALAGYAELWIAAFYCAAFMALINWNITGSRTQFLLALLMGLACVFVKKPGLVWASSLLPWILIGLFPVWLRYLTLGISFTGIILLVTTRGISLHFPGSQELVLSSDLIQIPGFGSFPMAFYPAAEFFLKNDLIRGNWHLMGWLLAILLPLAMLRSVTIERLLPGLGAITTGMLFIFGIFFFTNHYHSAVDSTTINRATFHLLPVLFYFVIVALSNHQITNHSNIAENSPST